MFSVPAFFAFMTGPLDRFDMAASRYTMRIVIFLFILIVGLRFEVGGDWDQYVAIVDAVAFEELSYSLGFGDPAFTLVSWLSTRVGIFESGPTFVCGAILMLGIWRFIVRQADPWLSLTAAVPYLIIVVGMGYVRQSAAIGLTFIAITALQEKRIWSAARSVFLAMLFHISAIFLVPFAALAIVRRNPAAVVALGLVGVPIGLAILLPRLDKFEVGYIDQELQSSGAGIRLLMNALPAIAFLIWQKKFKIEGAYRLFWILVSIFSILLFLGVVFTDYSTALDRAGLYFIPIQLFVFGNLPAAVTESPVTYRLWWLSITSLYSAVLAIWLFYGTHADAWLPYKWVV